MPVAAELDKILAHPWFKSVAIPSSIPRSALLAPTRVSATAAAAAEPTATGATAPAEKKMDERPASTAAPTAGQATNTPPRLPLSELHTQRSAAPQPLAPSSARLPGAASSRALASMPLATARPSIVASAAAGAASSDVRAPYSHSSQPIVRPLRPASALSAVAAAPTATSNSTSAAAAAQSASAVSGSLSARPFSSGRSSGAGLAAALSQMTMQDRPVTAASVAAHAAAAPLAASAAAAAPLSAAASQLRAAESTAAASAPLTARGSGGDVEEDDRRQIDGMRQQLELSTAEGLVGPARMVLTNASTFSLLLLSINFISFVILVCCVNCGSDCVLSVQKRKHRRSG